VSYVTTLVSRILKWLQDYLKNFYTWNIAYCLVQVRILPSQFNEGTLHGVAVKHIWTYKEEIL
jgi:hypothetical protein